MNAHEPQIFVSGTWRDSKAEKYSSAGERVGELIAEAGYSLACGPGTGIARYAVRGFRSVPGRTGKVRYFLPAREHMDLVGETIESGADEVVETSFDYPTRNVFQISRSAGLIVLTGSGGALEEILPALIDYKIPVGAYPGSGQAIDALEKLLEVFPEWRPSVLLSPDPVELVRFVLR